MHDPKSVAFEIRRPWREAPSKFWPKGYRPSMLTIWHHDPEKDGTDDSCGWFSPKLTEAQKDKLKNRIAWHEARNPYFLRCRAKSWTGTRAEAEVLYRGLVLLVARVLEIPMTFEKAAKKAAEYIHFPDCVDRAGIFCFLPGYHTHGKDTPEDRERLFHAAACRVARSILDDRRPWYRHPRWHIWHWRLQVHSILQFKRWAFSRCCLCGGRFTWGYSPVSYSWETTGPRWFRSEKAIFHAHCDKNKPAPADSGNTKGTP